MRADGSLRINFPMHLLDERTQHCAVDTPNRDHVLSLTDRKAPFLLLYQTLIKLGHRPACYAPGTSDISISWTAKHVDAADRNRAIVMEVAWLPRWHYQISPTGSNAQGHYARTYQFSPLDGTQAALTRAHAGTMRRLFERGVNPANVRRLEQQLPEEFVLFPLQLANDFNLKFSGTSLARFYSATENHGVALAQACVGLVSTQFTALPVVFRQHPFDSTANFRELLGANHSLIDNHDRVSCHDIFATGRCKAVVSVNSNTVHEAAVWNIPSVCLGTLIWNGSTNVPPFSSSVEDLPSLIGTAPLDEPRVLSYLHHLIRHQWTLADFQNPLMVESLLATRGECEPMSLRASVALAA